MPREEQNCCGSLSNQKRRREERLETRSHELLFCNKLLKETVSSMIKDIQRITMSAKDSRRVEAVEKRWRSVRHALDQILMNALSR